MDRYNLETTERGIWTPPTRRFDFAQRPGSTASSTTGSTASSTTGRSLSGVEWRFAQTGQYILTQTSNRNCFRSFGNSFAFGDFFNPSQYRRMVIAITAFIAYTYRDIFKHNETVFVLENLFSHQSLLHRAITIFAFIAIHFSQILGV